MRRKKICFIAQFPPPIHGLSKAVETLYHSNLLAEYEFEKIDITDNQKFIKNLLLILKSSADLYYFTISQTRGGNFRDLIILNMIRIQQKRCLIHLHGGYYRTLVDQDLPAWQKRMNYQVISQIEGAIVLGESLRWIFEGMIPEDKIYIVPNCVNDEYLLDDLEFEEKIRTSDSRDIKHVLYLSNFIKSKGYPEVLKMAAIEKERCKEGGKKQLHFDFAGEFFEKEDEKLFWEYIGRNGLEDYVTYHGVVDGCKKRELLKKCDVFILLTSYPKEGQPISILEAMGNGMVIITTNHAGIPDVVEDGINGIVVEKRMENQAYDIYSRILSLSILNIGKRNRSDIMLKFKEMNYLKNMKRIFNSILIEQLIE